MYPGTYAAQAPDRIAAVMTGTGETLSYGVPGPELEQEIIAYAKSKIASFKAPRIIRFVDELPRSEAGKLMKSQLKTMYAPG
jgi:acyl-coenzyme A synthetase/AMP-(fatty) acid ligase